jgi:uncharacterized RDD family membrane protein YckC
MAETSDAVSQTPPEDLDLGGGAELEYAGFWSRVAALIVDYAIVTILGLALLIAAASAGAGTVAIANIVYLLVAILYWPLLECSERQATLGKQLLGLQVVDANGARLTFVRSLLRNLAKIISSLPLGLGYVLAAFTPRKQALHDVITKCLVVRAGPSNFRKAVIAAVGALAITIAGSYYYFTEFYLPQMADGMKREMEQAMKQAPKGVPAKPAPAQPPVTAAPARAPAPAAGPPGAPKPMTPQEIAELEKKLAQAKPEPAKVAAAPAAAPATEVKPEPKPAVVASAKPKPEPKPAAPAATPKPPPPVEAPAAMAPEPPAPAPERPAAPRAPAAPAVALTPPTTGRVITLRYNDIMTAVMYRDTAAVGQLLELGWWVDRPDSNGVTPLMAAAWLGDAASAQLLLKGGADPNRSSPAGGPVLDYARRGGNAAVIELLRSGGAR